MEFGVDFSWRGSDDVVLLGCFLCRMPLPRWRSRPVSFVLSRGEVELLNSLGCKRFREVHFECVIS